MLQKFKGWTPDWEASVGTWLVLCHCARPSCHALTMVSSGRCIETKWKLVHLNAGVETGEVEGMMYSSTPIEGHLGGNGWWPLTRGKNNKKSPYWDFDYWPPKRNCRFIRV